MVLTLTIFKMTIRTPVHNIVLAIVGLTVVNSTFVFLLGISANVGMTFFKCPTIANM
ncbi:DNA internalization-related competence protein ComEC/Rec2 [Leadbetterella byssophila DSM 17132]|uniref:DNA internalization-related competence protein ComEC/Rec2 n=1 Tax=Leadbetterella byssophila (strain DSM 17132 / JCM 16389 / KACC 11308 / NBRC 106382 / 4M15) TaxID=649349 RepID=E4RW43_LEAB4|nr:DNA internalization-related competence protein ComEC/Rec2 [Leadbetterella byssophila DSM 17132]